MPFTTSLNPIVPWPIIVLAAAAVLSSTIWAYRIKLSGSAGSWRWLVVGLRIAAVLLCLLATLRPSLLVLRKAKQNASLVVLIDSSKSMTIGDEVGGSKRWDAARKVEKQALEIVKGMGPTVTAIPLRFDKSVRPDNLDDTAEPDGAQTALGVGLDESIKRMEGTKPLGVVVLSDGASNSGKMPLVAAQGLRSRQIPVTAIGFGTETVANSRDVSVRELVAGPTVYEKRELDVSGTLNARGFPGESLSVELWVEGQPTPVARKVVKVPERASLVPVRELKWTPTTRGETRLSLKVIPVKGELLESNNEYSTFVTVLKGGLNVLYLQGRVNSWESKFLTRALDADPKIELNLKRLARPAGADMDVDFAPGAYDVYILGDLPADYLSPTQQHMLVQAVQKGAGLIMVGGMASFGSGNWASAEVADILPVRMHPGDGQLDPEGGLKVVPNLSSLDSFVMRLGASRADTERLWAALPPIPGTNRFSGAKPNANVWATTPTGDPLMLGQEIGKGRVIAFGGETWIWARASEESRMAHLKFWRQAILWLAHKESEGDSSVTLTLDRRRVAYGDRLEVSAAATDAKGEPIRDAEFETTVTRDAEGAKPESLELFGQGNRAAAAYFATGAPGDYRVTTTAKRNGQTIGTDTARFIVFQDDRELENPAADHTLLRQIAQMTGGQFLPPERLAKWLKSLDKEATSQTVVQNEIRIWDTWPFLLLFAILLAAEWWLRKRHGWA